MARYFDITAVTTSIELDAARTGQAAFTVTNATSASIRGDAVVVPESGAEAGKYQIDEPSRHFGPGATDQFTVKVTAPVEMAAGTYGIRLRMLLGGGIPEEQFDDGPIVRYTVAKIEEPPPPPPPPPKKPFPWWIVAVIAAVIAIIVIGVIIFILTRPKPEPQPILDIADLVIPQTYVADLDTGTLTTVGGDMWFEAITATDRFFSPWGSTGLAYMGANPPGYSGCSTASLTGMRIDVASVPAGHFVCVKTDSGRFAELRLNEAVGASPGLMHVHLRTWQP